MSVPRTCLPLALAAALAALLGPAGCATLDPVLARPPDGAYRIPGRAPDPMPSSAGEGVLSYTLPLAGGRVEYGAEVSMTSGMIRVQTVVRNAGRSPVRYRLGALSVAARDGEPLVRRGLEELPSLAPAAEERRSEAYRGGLRQIAPGERLSLVRRLVLPGPSGVRVLDRLSLSDEVEAGDATETVRLELSRAQ